MAVALSFWAGQNAIADIANSGLGFYGGSFGAAVRVNNYQSTTFVTNSTGSAQGPQAWNIKYTNSASGIVAGASSGIALTAIPNGEATLRVCLTSDTAIQTQNASFRCYDRTSENNPQSGVTFQAAELIHPNPTEVTGGSGDETWSSLAGSSVVLTMADSPGLSGLYAADGADGGWSDTQMDWYLALSASPTSIGSKTLFGGQFSVEYY